MSLALKTGWIGTAGFGLFCGYKAFTLPKPRRLQQDERPLLAMMAAVSLVANVFIFSAIRNTNRISYLTDRGWKSLNFRGDLSNIPDGITGLNISNCAKLTDTQLADVIARSPGIKTLRVVGCPEVTGSSFASLRSLEELSLIGDAFDFTHFSEATALRKLSLSIRGLTDDGLAPIKTFTGLERLSLSNCRLVTPTIFTYFKPLTNLTKVEIRGAQQILRRNFRDLNQYASITHVCIDGSLFTRDLGASYLWEAS